MLQLLKEEAVFNFNYGFILHTKGAKNFECSEQCNETQT